MNKGIFFATFLKITRPASIFNILLFVFGIPTFIAYLFYKSGDAASLSSIFEPLFNLGPALTMVVAFMFVSNLSGNAKSLNDGEYMALLFSRPLSRASYVFSKWLAGSLLVFLIVSSQMTILTFLLHLVGCDAQYGVTLIDIVNIFINALGTTALIVMLHAFPARVGLTLFLGLLYLTFAAPLVFDLGFGKSSPMSIAAQTIVGTICNVLRGFFYSSFDLNLYLNSVHVFWFSAIAFLSNLVSYLWIAILVLNSREFFYANE